MRRFVFKVVPDALRTATAGGCWTNWMEVVAADAVVRSDVVMAELDRRRDAELEEARS